MQLVRFLSNEGRELYGTYESGLIDEIEGSIYGDFKKAGPQYRLEDVKLLAPCVPGKIICIGLNYPDHIEELGYPTPVKPANFMKPNSAILNPDEEILVPKETEQVDYEGELAVIIKNEIKGLSPEAVKEHILGVTPSNDITERVLSNTSTLVTYSKAFDTFMPFGPAIDTSIDPDDAVIITYLNGKKVQEGKTKETLFKPSEIVSFLNKWITLYPGDLILTGTPSGVGSLVDGDIVEVEIEGSELILKNPVVEF